MKDRPNITFEDLNKKISNYITDSDELSLIKEAYQYADQIHKGQKRLDKTDYIKHPLNVAYILAEISVDY